MKPSLQKLHNFLKLEAERGYDNRAVLGGFDRMLPSWEAEARAENIPEEFIQSVVARLGAYARLSPHSRAETLDGLWRRIQREANISPPPLPTARKLSTPGRGENSPREKTGSPSKSTSEQGISFEDTESIDGMENPFPEKAHDQEHSKEHSEFPESTAYLTDERESTPEPSPPQKNQPASEQPKPAPPEHERIPEGPPAALNAPITVLPGVGPRHAQTLKNLNLSTLGDMLYYLPRRYDDYSKLRPINRLFYGDEVTVIGTVQSAGVRPIRSGRVQIFEAIISDGSGSLRITWFNQPWIAKRLRSGMHVVLSGKIDQYLGRLVMNNPK